MDCDVPKQYLPINGRAIIRHTIEKLMPFATLYCVIGADHEELYQQAVDGLNLPDPIIGGVTRQESVRLGLKALEAVNPDFVLIHDAARPCLYTQDIHNVINRLDDNFAVTLARPINETLQKDGAVIDRENMWAIQTPQAFSYDVILDCHNKAYADGFIATDDASITSNYGYDIDYVPGGVHNIKITTQGDLEMAHMLLSESMETRVGNGFDVHAFADHDAKMIRLCGVDIPYHKALKGHSDADVGLHAISDAIFGAMADGDIGSHFPPSNDDFENMDSHVFLDKSVDILKSRGGKIRHIDLTFMCEEPKIGKHREEIRNHLSNHLNLSTSRISVKATTTEKLGFTGRGEGIAAQAIVTIQVPSHD